MATAYCVKCHSKNEVKNPEETTWANGRRALKGTCAVCGTKVQSVLPNK